MPEISRWPSLRPLALKNKILWQFEFLKKLRRFVWKKLLESKTFPFPLVFLFVVFHSIWGILQVVAHNNFLRKITWPQLQGPFCWKAVKSKSWSIYMSGFMKMVLKNLAPITHISPWFHYFFRPPLSHEKERKTEKGRQ